MRVRSKGCPYEARSVALLPDRRGPPPPIAIETRPSPGMRQNNMPPMLGAVRRKDGTAPGMEGGIRTPKKNEKEKTGSLRFFQLDFRDKPLNTGGLKHKKSHVSAWPLSHIMPTEELSRCFFWQNRQKPCQSQPCEAAVRLEHGLFQIPVRETSDDQC